MSDMNQIVVPNDTFFRNLLDELGNSGHVLLKVRGHSMFPFFRNGRDSVQLRPFIAGEGLKKGDVALFRFHGRFILHRCIGKRASAYIFRGDGNCKGTEWALPEDIFAVVEKRISPSAGASSAGASSSEGASGDSSGGSAGWEEWSCGSFSWRLCSWLWPRTYTVRRLLLAFLRRVYK